MDNVAPDQGSVFGADPAPQAQDTQAVQFAIPTEVAELVGEGKKYATPEEALRSVPHAQSHIAQLQKELEELRGVVSEQTEELKKRASAEAVISKVHQQPAQSTQTQEVDINAVITAATQAAVKATKDEALKEKHDSNEIAVSMAMRKVYGDNAKSGEAIAAKAAEMEVPAKYLQDIARTKPKMFYQLMGISEQSLSNDPQPLGGAPAKTSGMQSLEAVNQNNIAHQKPKKSILAGATTAEVVSEWRRCGELIKQEGNN